MRIAFARFARVTLLAASVASTSNAAAQAPLDSSVVSTALGARMDNYMKRAEALGFSGQVLVAKGGDVLLHRAFGLRDRRNQLAMRTSTAVGVASMSKQFAAAAILKLESEGRLRLTDTLGQYFVGLPTDKRVITIQQVLTHTGGIQGGTTDDFDVATLVQSLARLFSLPLTGAPGKEWQYSSDAYGIVAAIVQRVAGMPYELYMHKFIFQPAGMTHTGFWNEARAMPEVARSYSGLRDRGTPAAWPRDWRVFGSGDVMTTAADLYRWDRALRSGRVLSPATLTKYLTPQVTIGSGPDMYGYGLFFEKSSRSTGVVEHGGDTEIGFNGAFFRYIDENAVLIVTSNAHDSFGRSLRQYVQGDLDKILFGNDSVSALPDVARVNRSQQRQLTGSYAIDTAGTVHLISDGQTLWIAADGQDAVDLLRPVSVASPSLLRSVNARTDTLMRQLLDRDTSAYAHALGDSGIAHIDDYRSEWSGLLQKLGPLNGFRVMGSIQDRNSILTYVLLSFARNDLPMTFRWSQLGAGRLASTNPETAPPYPVMIPLVMTSQGKLVAYDFWRAQTRAKVDVANGVLRIQHIEAQKPAGTVVTAGPVSRSGWTMR